MIPTTQAWIRSISTGMEIKHLSAVLSPMPDTVCKQETVGGGLSS